MKKQKLRALIAAKDAALKRADPKSRDRIRRQLKTLQVAWQISKESKAA